GTSSLSRKSAAFCPTVIHEAYHTLVFKMKWDKQEASEVLTEVIADENNAFVNQTVRTTKVGLNMAVGHGLGGRDSLILATCCSDLLCFSSYPPSVRLDITDVRCGRRDYDPT